MRAGVWYLSWRHLRTHWGQATVLVLCYAVVFFIPSAAELLIDRYERELMARAGSTPLVAGARGNRFDLTLAALYFRQANLEPVPVTEADALQEEEGILAIPLNVRHTARKVPIVATSPEYFEWRALEAKSGTLPLQLGDVVLGARAAESMGLSAGEALFSDPSDLYDISKPPALKMRITGVLEETGRADDDVVFVDIKTAWILEGVSHAHQDVTKDLDPKLVLGRSEDQIVVSPALVTYQEVTEDNVASFHYHGDRVLLPLTAILVVPETAKIQTMLKARINTAKVYQMVVPKEVMEDLMSIVFRVKTLFEGLWGLLAGATIALTGLVWWLSTRLRAAEMQTLERLGCRRFTVAWLYVTEFSWILFASVILTLLGLWLTSWLLPRWFLLV